MGFWRLLREEPITTRLAGPADRAAVAALLARTWRRQGSLAAEDQVALLQAGISPLAVIHDEAIGFLGLSQRSAASAAASGPAETWVDINLVALNPDQRPERILAALLEWALPLLRRRGCAGLVCLTSLSWLQEGLLRAGFQQEDQVVTYVHHQRRLGIVPEPAQLRAAGASDADTVLAINARAFAPFWQYDDAVVLSWLLTADRAVLAYIDGRPAGFALTTDGLSGNYAHLIRIATDPDFQGRGVGRQLVYDALRHAYAADAPGLALNTQASNRFSRRLYESLGFRATGQALSVLVYRLGDARA
ncbi:MAG: ribosomal-protein-alanine N-acetyltransferase [Chloroflexi bacterium ADurb.Bin325]|nr:MAG: ribosomal-protein-alanine N-acetyltransferase [Chloroflexi bacterium ADurb.Bin325]